MQNLKKNKGLIKKYKKQIKAQKKCPSKNIHILNKIDSIFELDQKVRSNKYWKSIQYYNKHKNDTSKNSDSKFLLSQKLYYDYNKTDSSNIKFMMSLINENEYIGEEMIGYNNWIKVQVILLHFDQDTNNILLEPILNNALRKNKITPLNYSQIIDRHLTSTNQTQKYWTWMFLDSNPNFTKKEIDQIIKLREGIGLWGSEVKVIEYRRTWTMKNLFSTCY